MAGDRIDPGPPRREPRAGPFARTYTAADIRRLAEVDEAYDQMSGLATREVLRRQFEVYGEADYARLAAISNGHVYNLRASATYRAISERFLLPLLECRARDFVKRVTDRLLPLALRLRRPSAPYGYHTF